MGDHRGAEGLARELEDLTARMQAAVGTGDADQVQRLSREIRRVATDLKRAHNPRRPRRVGPSVRDLTMDALAELGAPAEPRLVSSYIADRYGEELAPSRFASLRRDARRSGTSALTRPAVVAPLDWSRLTPVHGLVAVSTWPLEQRIVAPRSRRVWVLEAARSIVGRLAWMREQDPEAHERLSRTAAAMLSSVPGAVDDPWADVDVEQATVAIDAELEVIQAEDEQQRHEAARRAREQLDELSQVFGAEPIGVVRDGRSSGGR